jgi:uncharacterized protein (TIRG00374 family)
VTADDEQRTKNRSLTRRIIVRVLLLIVTAIGLYGVWPGLLDVLSTWPSLRDVNMIWMAAAFVLEAASFVCFWIMTKEALQIRSLFLPATSQLASNAISRIIPGGAATGGAVQYSMLATAGVEGPRIATALTAVTLLATAMLLAFPVLSLPAILGGAQVDRGLVQAAFVGLAAVVLGSAAGAAAVAWDRPLEIAAAAAQSVTNWVRSRILRSTRPANHDLPVTVLRERDLILGVLQRRWWSALMTTLGKVGLDFFALLACLTAVGARPRPSVVLIAYVVANLLGMVPITPGGLGFVETGLVATLGLAGVPAGEATLATLAYRLVSFWLPIPAGLVAYVMFKARYRASASPPVHSGPTTAAIE